MNLREVPADINFELDNCLKQKDAGTPPQAAGQSLKDRLDGICSLPGSVSSRRQPAVPLSPVAEPVSSHFPPVEALHPSALYKHQLVAKVTSIKDSRGNSSVQSIFSSSVEDHRQHEAFCK